jgi:antirestriction protein ArdC
MEFDAQMRKGEKSNVGIIFRPLTKEDEDGKEKTIPMVRTFRVLNVA